MSGILTRIRAKKAGLRAPMVQLLHTPEALRGALVLLAGTAAALVWANLPGEGYDEFWHLEFGFVLGDAHVELDLRHWVNDALMAFFFALLTLEVRRELEMGELRDWRRASVPVVAAIAGLAIPALVYVGFTWGTEVVGGWGIVVSTDTAFVLGMLALVGRIMPPQLRVFLVTLAVADDIGALGVIAFAYTDHLNPLALLLAAGGLAVIVLMRFAGVWRGLLYFLPSVVVWVGFFLSGVHATLAGVAIALALPIFATRQDDLVRAQRMVRRFQVSPSADYARHAEDSLARAISVNERAHRALSPYVSWLILPIFALANAGVRVTPESLADAFSSRLTWGIIAGLVLGKIVAITLSTWIMVRIRPDALGPGLRMSHIVGVSILSGMGFTISLFVADLAFDDPADVSHAQIGVIAASVIAAVLGAIAFGILTRIERRRAPERTRLTRPLDPREDHVRGEAPEAEISMVGYGSYDNAFSPYATEVIAELRDRFGDRVLFGFRHLIAGQAFGRVTALAAEAAARQGRFWQMHANLMDVAPVESKRQIRQAAAQAGLNLRRFETDWKAEIGAALVDQHIADVAEMKLHRAPTFFIDDVVYEGPVDPDSLAEAIEAALDAAARRRASV